MFIRFKRRKLRNKTGKRAEYSLHAVLVENYREKGKRRQRIIKYLGSITSEQFHDHSYRNSFFRVLIRRLNNLNLEPHVLATIQTMLVELFMQHLERVPKNERDCRM